MITPLLVGLLCLGLLTIAYNHIHGNFHRLKQQLGDEEVDDYAGPGGQPPVTLTRTVSSLGSQAEFTSLTLFPGRGMQMEQIHASIPGMGDVPLLVDLPSDNLSTVLTNKGNDAGGRMSPTFGGAFLAPWIGQLTGEPVATNPELLTTTVVQQPVQIFASADNASTSVEGSLSGTAATKTETVVLAEGQAVTSTFEVGTKKDWPSTLEMTGSVRLTGQAIDVTWVVKNTGGTAVPFALAWRPILALPDSTHGHMQLYVPSTSVLSRGKIQDVKGGEQDFSQASGTNLTGTALDSTYVNLSHALLDDGPAVEVRNSQIGTGLRLTMAGDGFQAVHIRSDRKMSWISLEPESTAEGESVPLLAPGASKTLRLRLEIFPIGNRSRLKASSTP
ncbi:MAG: hypothetical protein PW792_08325 [Acidobacteriaceae bacterium]|nr:hypothetical protein [Acidobacteriaceae bacterium]